MENDKIRFLTGFTTHCHPYLSKEILMIENPMHSKTTDIRENLSEHFLYEIDQLFYSVKMIKEEKFLCYDAVEKQIFLNNFFESICLHLRTIYNFFDDNKAKSSDNDDVLASKIINCWKVNFKDLLENEEIRSKIKESYKILNKSVPHLTEIRTNINYNERNKGIHEIITFVHLCFVRFFELLKNNNNIKINNDSYQELTNKIILEETNILNKIKYVVENFPNR
jgi:hypothetical protein